MMVKQLFYVQSRFESKTKAEIKAPTKGKEISQKNLMKLR
jgi:hypothetical protein